MKSHTEKKMNYALNCKYSISFADPKLPKEIWRLDLNSVTVTFPSSEECLHNFTSVCKKTAFFSGCSYILMRFTKLSCLYLSSPKWTNYFWEKPHCSQALEHVCRGEAGTAREDFQACSFLPWERKRSQEPFLAHWRLNCRQLARWLGTAKREAPIKSQRASDLSFSFVLDSSKQVWLGYDTVSFHFWMVCKLTYDKNDVLSAQTLQTCGIISCKRKGDKILLWFFFFNAHPISKGLWTAIAGLISLTLSYE